jgi:hypothetical protein
MPGSLRPGMRGACGRTSLVFLAIFSIACPIGIGKFVTPAQLESGGLWDNFTWPRKRDQSLTDPRTGAQAPPQTEKPELWRAGYVSCLPRPGLNSRRAHVWRGLRTSLRADRQIIKILILL